MLSLHLCAAGQNLVPNGNFEQYTSCPTSFNQVAYAPGWRSYHAGDVDYFNSCASGLVGVPGNAFGSQLPISGNGYAGAYLFLSPTNNTYREYLASSMTPMVAGNTYDISLYVSLAEFSGYAGSDLGVWFYDNGPTGTISGQNALIFTPQISFGHSSITDTINWIRLSAVYLADSAYDNLVIGGFTSTGSMNQTYMKPTSTFCYYYFDSIEIRVDRNITYTLSDSVFCSGDTITVPYSVFAGSFNSNNVFSLQVSNSAGSFASPIVLATNASPNSGVLKGVIPPGLTGSSNYRLRIVSSNPADSSAVSRGITLGSTVPPKPNASSNAPVCNGGTLQLSSSTGIANTTYKWTSSTGFSSNVQNPTISPVILATAGQYYVVATLYGCNSKDTTTVTVKPLPAFTLASNSPICQGDSMKINVTSLYPAATYSWIGPNSYSSSVKDQVKANMGVSGSGYYVSTATLNSCVYKDSTNVTVKPLPIISTATNSPLCSGSTLSLNCYTSNAASFSWSGPGSYFSNAQSPSIGNVQTSQTGKYVVVAALNGCYATDTANVLIEPTPPTPLPSANTPVCVGQTLSLSSGSVTAPIYNWTGPSGFSSNAKNPSLAGASAAMGGTYTIQTVEGSCYSPAVDISVTVLPAPDVHLSITPTDSICLGSAVLFTATGTNAGGGALYTWYQNKNVITTASGASFFTSSSADLDQYFCTLTSNGTCAIPYTDSSNIITMHVLPWLSPSVSIDAQPDSVIHAGDIVTFNALPVNGGLNPLYHWRLNNADVPGVFNDLWSSGSLQDGDVVCAVMNSGYQCPLPQFVNSNCIKITVTTVGINSTAINSVHVYPNPVNNELIIEGIADRTLVKLFDMTGRVVYQFTTNKDTERINTGTFNSGTYLLQLIDQNGLKTSVRVQKQ